MVEGVDGARIVIPAGALHQPREISVGRDSGGAPRLFADPIGEIYAVTPHGETFDGLATVRIPFDAARVDAGYRVVVMKASVGQGWRPIEPVEVGDGFATVEVGSLSWFTTSRFLAEPPTTPGPGATVLQLRATSPFVQLPDDRTDVVLYQQPAIDQPLTVTASAWIGSSSAEVAQCDSQWGYPKLSLLLQQAVVYHLPSDGDSALVNRVAISPDVVVEPVEDFGYSTTALLPELLLDTQHTVNVAVDSATLIPSWGTPGVSSPSYHVPVPAGAIVDAAAKAITMDLSCCGLSYDDPDDWEGPTPDCAGGTFAFPTLVVARGFPVSQITFVSQPPTTLTLLEGDLLSLPDPVAAADFPVTGSWERRDRAATTWAPVPTSLPNGATYGVVDSTWNGLTGYVQAATDDGARFRFRACGNGACVTSSELTLQVTRNFPTPGFPGPARQQSYNVGQHLDLSLTFTARPLPAIVRWQTRASTTDPWQDVDPTRYTNEPFAPPGFVNYFPDNSSATDRLRGLQPLTLADRGRQFRATFTNVAGTATSAETTLWVSTGQAPPSVTQQPSPATVPAGAPALFIASVTGAMPLSYQWRKDGVRLVGANGPMLVLNGVSAADAGSYELEISNVEDRVTTTPVTLTVTGGMVPARITRQPGGYAALTGSAVTFSVGATGSEPLSYQWRKDGVAIPGATAATYDRLALTSADEGQYAVEVRNPAGTVVSADAALRVLPARLPMMNEAPSVTTQPTPAAAFEGDTASFAAAVTGVPMPECRWLRDGRPIAGATSCTDYTTPPLTPADDGVVYNLIAFNPAGTVIADGAEVTVAAVQVPTITRQPQAASVIEGQTAVFSVAASSNAPLRFQWRRQGVGDVPGGTDDFLAVPSTTLADSGARFVARVCAGAPALGRCVDSAEALLTVGPTLPANALTARQVLATYAASVVVRPDRTVWGWGSRYRRDGTLADTVPAGQEAYRPVRLYPAALTDVEAVTGWYDSYWALTGTPGTVGSRVVHWGVARHGVDGRGADGAGGGAGPIPQLRYNYAAPVEALERVLGVPVPVDRVCQISGGAANLLLIRAISPAGVTTSCAPGAAKTVWVIGTLTQYGADSAGVAVPMPGLPTDSPPSVLFHGPTVSGSPPYAIALEDGRAFGQGENPYNGFGLPVPAPSWLGGAAGPVLLPTAWGAPRRFAATFYYAIFALRADGSVMTSGYSAEDELGVGDLPGNTRVDGPVAVRAEWCLSTPCTDPLTGVTELVGNDGLAMIAIKGGVLLGWGSGSTGLLGPGLTAGMTQPFPRPIAAPVSGFTALSSASAHALALGPGGAVYAWGQANFGALGDGASSGRVTAPTLVTTP